jgi:hypothetical protein
VVPAQAFEITLTGPVGWTLRAEFDDRRGTAGRTRPPCADLPDQAARCGLVQRITGLGLDILHVHLVKGDRS